MISLIRWMNAFILCVVMVIVVTSVFKREPAQPKEVSAARKVVEPKVEKPLVAQASASLPAAFASRSAPKPPPAPAIAVKTPERPVATTAIGELCRAYDPVNHPEQTSDILILASDFSRVPFDVLYIIWPIETGVLYGSNRISDHCDVMEQLEIRRDVGKRDHVDAMKRLATLFHWKLDGMKCSCGKSTPTFNAHNFGGCCGPFQFSAAEIEADATRLGVDPMTFCGGAVIMGLELRRYYDRLGSWEAAISRHLGTDINGHYYGNAYAKWAEINPYLEDKEHPERLRAFLARKASYGIEMSRQSMRDYSFLQASN